jgi:hypothetical protein
MTVTPRRLASFVALGAVFLAGWGAARANAKPVVPQRDALTPSARAAEACTDHLAMEANANLVGQVQDYKRQLTFALDRATDAEQRAMTVANAPPARIVSSREEWGRMARDRSIRVKAPCETWSSTPRFSTRKQGSGFSVGTRIGRSRMESNQRAALAGISAEELETLGEAYQRVHARTWAAMRSTCEAQPAFREWIASHEDEVDDLTDMRRIEICRSTSLDVNDPNTRPALLHMAELRATGQGGERAASDEERIAFAVTNAPAVLFDEMVKTLGREKAIRAIDNGIVCVDETAYDLREAASADEG